MAETLKERRVRGFTKPKVIYNQSGPASQAQTEAEKQDEKKKGA